MAKILVSSCLLGCKVRYDKNIALAVLTELSPSCGSSAIYDGSFNGTKKAGLGVTAALLKENGIKVYSQHEVCRLLDKVDL